MACLLRPSGSHPLPHGTRSAGLPCALLTKWRAAAFQETHGGPAAAGNVAQDTHNGPAAGGMVAQETHNGPPAGWQ
eukprot:63259-Chlamydomonas_euryale.AAC.1